MKLLYKDVDITDRIEILRCTHDSYAEENADTLTLVVRDNDQLWDAWGPEIGDEIRVTNGHQDTGVMFVKKTEPGVGTYTIRASSLPISANEARSNAWEQITFKTIAKQVADDLSFKLKIYGITDHVYKYLRQKNERGIDLLQRLCILQGCSFLVYDKQIIVYSHQFIRDQEPKQTATLTADCNMSFKTELGYSGCAVSNGTHSALYQIEKPYKHVTELPLDIYMASIGEAQLFARNMLNYLNRNEKSGFFYSSPIAEGYSAGTVINIKSDMARSFDGKVFIYHIRHEYQTDTSKIFFRK